MTDLLAGWHTNILLSLYHSITPSTYIMSSTATNLSVGDLIQNIRKKHLIHFHLLRKNRVLDLNGLVYELQLKNLPTHSRARVIIHLHAVFRNFYKIIKYLKLKEEINLVGASGWYLSRFIYLQLRRNLCFHLLRILFFSWNFILPYINLGRLAKISCYYTLY